MANKRKRLMSAYIQQNGASVHLMENTGRESYNQDLKKSKVNSTNGDGDMNDSELATNA